MANEDSPSFSLRISQIETQKGVHDSNQVLGFTPGKFDYTKLGFSENRSKQWNDPEKLKILREAFATKNLDSDIQMEDQDEIEHIPNLRHSRNLTPSSQELNYLELSKPLMFGLKYHDTNVAQAVSVQMRLDAGPSSHPPAKKQKLVDECENFSLGVANTKKQSKKLSKEKHLAGSSRDHSEPRVSLDKDNVAHNVEMKDVDKASSIGDKMQSLSKLDLDNIKSYVKAYIAQYPLHESEKGIQEREGGPPQSLNEHKMDAKSDNVVDNAGQSSKVGSNEGRVEECLKDSKKALHNTDEALSKAITLYIPPLPVAYPIGITDIASATLDTYDRQGNTDSQCYISDNVIAAISQVPVCKTNLTYVRKKPSKRNRQPSNLYQSPFVTTLMDHMPKMSSLSSLFGCLLACTAQKLATDIVWNLIDEVYVSINYEGSFHWMLAVIGLKERCIRVYDSLKGHRGHGDEIKKLAKILSTCLTISNFFERKERTDWSLLEVYKEKMEQDAFDIQFVDEIIQQSSGMLDCGLFVSTYAKYLSDRYQIPSSDFDLEKHRTRYASLLCDCGMNKAYNGYVSDNQNSPRPKRIFIPYEDTEIIDVES
ncbi:hypothetical protein FXO38_05551 [Capsicum annuum]|uniref:Ubiquitin-like protease family profile domain-containing protein n=1 Tax=Capsicum annuum TaxID=4072 RepID=A0A2G2YY14_CAPAN|nr:hypothetical protein FXO37_32614 [Capsicum annuum]KAF3673676.1 hypothetical protein FXO38_05551 [Capsicum annuum]PHT74648.1 hypothetical protein T459_21925 [Capsicum annuum]